MMISAQTLHVAALVSAAARCIDDVIELDAELRAVDDCADVALLSEDDLSQSTPRTR
jgi:hypothetical protein